MEKITIIAKNGNMSDRLSSLVQALFPECEISVVFAREDYMGEQSGETVQALQSKSG
jgi:hypothetical protein